MCIRDRLKPWTDCGGIRWRCMYIGLDVVSAAVVIKMMRWKDVVDIFGVGNKCLRTQWRPLWHAAAQVHDPGGGIVDVNCLRPVCQVRREPGKCWIMTERRCWRILRSSWWSTVSNAADMSKRTRAPTRRICYLKKVKPTPDKDQLSNYRPISQVSFHNVEIIKRVVKSQLTDHLDSNGLHNPHQSAYCKHHSTETALLYIHDHLVSAIGSKKLSCLCLFGLSAAFDAIDYNILITCLASWLEFTDLS